jgi:DNA-binding MarR family transcriptional regulator
MNGFNEVGSYLDNKRFKKRPRYSLVLHDVREKLGLSLNTYVVIDSIHKLSTSDSRFPYCVMSKDDLADFLTISRRTVFRSIAEAEERGLIERCEHGLRATDLWIRSVEIYSIEAK